MFIGSPASYILTNVEERSHLFGGGPPYTKQGATSETIREVIELLSSLLVYLTMSGDSYSSVCWVNVLLVPAIGCGAYTYICIYIYIYTYIHIYIYVYISLYECVERRA